MCRGVVGLRRCLPLLIMDHFWQAKLLHLSCSA
jgi:hypothetical protein